jgi:hypothetical protein
VDSANNWLDIALNNKEWMIKIISASYPLNTSLLECYSDRWNFDGHGGSLSSNTSFIWTEGLIERYADRWDWDALSTNGSLRQLIRTIDEKTIGKIMNALCDSDNKTVDVD